MTAFLLTMEMPGLAPGLILPARGITLVNYTSDQFSGFKNVVVTGTLRDSLIVLEGLLNQETGLHPGNEVAYLFLRGEKKEEKRQRKGAEALCVVE